jgi:Mn2+/Fe2+ NRAMP family transporter
MLWTMPLAYLLMAAIQSICARIGRVTGRGLAANIKATFPGVRWRCARSGSGLRSVPSRHGVGVFGATISPPLFFWQASEQIEDMRGAAPLMARSRGRRIQIDFGQCDLTAHSAV